MFFPRDKRKGGEDLVGPRSVTDLSDFYLICAMSFVYVIDVWLSERRVKER